MHYGTVIHKAWELTQREKKLKWFAFVPAFVAVVVFLAEVVWQFYWYRAEFGAAGEISIWQAFGAFFSFLSQHDLVAEAIFFVFFILIFAFIIPAWTEGVILLGARSQRRSPETRLSLRATIIRAFRYFFPMFEFRAVMTPFQYLTVLFFLLTFYRLYHDIFAIFWPIIFVYCILMVGLNFFFAFTPHFILYENLAWRDAMKKSFSLVFLNFGATLAVIGLMMLVNLRILVNVLVILGIPALGFLALSYFASSGWLGFVIFVVGAMSVGAIFLASYLAALLEVFSASVWEQTFAHLQAKKLLAEPENESSEN